MVAPQAHKLLCKCIITSLNPRPASPDHEYNTIAPNLYFITHWPVPLCPGNNHSRSTKDSWREPSAWYLAFPSPNTVKRIVRSNTFAHSNGLVQILFTGMLFRWRKAKVLFSLYMRKGVADFRAQAFTKDERTESKSKPFVRRNAHGCSCSWHP